MLRKFLTFTLLLIIAASCKKDDTVDYEPIDKKIIEDYLAANQLTAQSTASGLHYIISAPGGTIHPNINLQVKVKYKGYLVDGTIFDQGTITYALSKLIKGWQEGLPLIGVGGKIKLLIPSALGYGASAQGSAIPANSVLIFDMELLDCY
jgi:FKBP-type peptidyl-prolyl cis-trans isomerase FkpA